MAEDVARGRSVWWAGLASAALLWVALPPCGWSWLGWLAPLPWLLLVRLPALPGRRPYVKLWVTASLFWLAYLQGVRLAHPALYLGWIALSLYLAAYIPCFIALSRVAVHRLRWPLAVAAPIVWVGLELIRGRLLSGFTGGMLGHTQSFVPPFIQVADLGGAYLLSGLMMVIASCLVECGVVWRDRHAVPRALLGFVKFAGLALAVFAGLLGYGAWRLDRSPLRDVDPGQRLRIALIQESIDTIFEYNPERNVDAFQRYLQRSLDACATDGPFDVIVWPESMFTENSPEFLAPDEIRVDELVARQATFARKAQYVMAKLRSANAGRDAMGEASEPPPARTALIAGTITIQVDRQGGREYNSALLLAPDGHVADRYYKRHLVMFGEYIPFGDWFPWFYRLAGMPGGLAEGEHERAFEVNGWRLAPSICFESLVPHHMRSKIVELERQGRAADVQVNLTNDGWFWGSSLLDMHLQAGVFRAVELRRPFVVAANTGLSAWVDSDGRLQAQAPRRAGATVVAEVQRDGRSSVYQRVGDAPWWCCALVCALLTLCGLRAGWLGAGRLRS